MFGRIQFGQNVGVDSIQCDTVGHAISLLVWEWLLLLTVVHIIPTPVLYGDIL